MAERNEIMGNGTPLEMVNEVSMQQMTWDAIASTTWDKRR